MSINLLFTNPNERLDKMNINTWNSIAGPGSVTAVDGTAGEIDVVTLGGTATVSFPTAVDGLNFPSNITTCESGTGAIAIGTNVFGGNCNTIDPSNMAIGENALLHLSTGERNIAIGKTAGADISTANDNICIGDNSYQTGNPTTGANIVIGSGAGNNLGNTNNNVCIGYFAGARNPGYSKQININDAITLNDNGGVCIGYDSYQMNNTGRGELVVSVGDTNLLDFVPSAGNNTVAVGSYCGQHLTTGNYNVLVGNQNLSFVNNVTSATNVVVGNFSGESVSNGNANVIIGNLACVGDATVASTCQNNIVIGNGAGTTNFSSASANCLLIGNSADCATVGQSNYISLNTNVPVLYGTASKLTIPNFKNIWDTNPVSSGLFLTSDVSGNLSWTSTVGPVTGTASVIFNSVTTTFTASVEYIIVGNCVLLKLAFPTASYGNFLMLGTDDVFIGSIPLIIRPSSNIVSNIFNVNSYTSGGVLSTSYNGLIMADSASDSFFFNIYGCTSGGSATETTVDFTNNKYYGVEANYNTITGPGTLPINITMTYFLS